MTDEPAGASPAVSSWPPPVGSPANAGPGIAPWIERAQVHPAAPVRYEVVRGAAVTLVLVALGAPLGLLWSLLVPRLSVYRVGNPAYLLTAKTEDLAAPGGDLVMLAVLAGAGVLAALVTLIVCRTAMVGALIGLLVGGLCCGLIAMAVGHVLVSGDYHAVNMHREDGTVFAVRPYVRGSADFLILPLFATFVYLLVNLQALVRGKAYPGLSSGTAARG